MTIFEYVAAKHLESGESILFNGPWDVRFLDNYWMYVLYPPFNYLPVMFCATKGGFEMNNLLKRSNRFDECCKEQFCKNTMVETAHGYFNMEVGCNFKTLLIVLTVKFNF